MDYNLPVVITAAALGMSHALDADHVLAVSTLNQQRPGLGRISRFCIHWSAGHGLTLACLGLLLYGAGIRLPSATGIAAEIIVGLLLTFLGGWLLFAPHHRQTTIPAAAGRHTPTCIGMIHGLAGAAPILALVPTGGADGSMSAIAFLISFSLGIAAAMLLFAVLYSHTLRWLQHHSLRLLSLTRTLLAGAAMAAGVHMILEYSL